MPPHPPSPIVEPQAFRWIPQLFRLEGRRVRAQVRLVALAVLVGLVAGLAAVVFSVACRAVEHYALGLLVGYEPPAPHGETPLRWLAPGDVPLRPWLLLIVPAVGGLITGVLVYTFAPEAEGHGTDNVIAAYHYHQGQIRPLVPLVKIVASAFTLGTGGSGGREGPIAQVGAGFGSLLANLLRLRPVEHRILVAAGMGAGIAAIFRAPLAGALFAAEVLYRSPEFESEVIIPAGIASVVAYSVFGSVFGWEALFATSRHPFTNPLQLGPYLVLAVWMILLAMLYTRTFYACQRFFRVLPIPRMVKPALGAFATGAVGLGLYLLMGEESVLAVLSFGYGILQESLGRDAGLAAEVLLAVALGKILTTSLTIGSGGSAGVFGASMVIGGCGAGALGLFFHYHWPELVPHPRSFIIVGMAGFFAAAAKTPFSTIVMVSELTGDYTLLLPALWVCSLTFLFSDEQSIYGSQVASRALSPAHQGGYLHEILAAVPVGTFLTPAAPVPVLHPDDSLAAATERLDGGAQPVLPVVDADGRLLGVVNLLEVHMAVRPAAGKPPLRAGDVLQRDVVPLRADDRLDRAVELFVENDLPALPVVDQGRVVGIVRRTDIASAYLRIERGPAADAEPSSPAGPGVPS